MKRTLLQRGAIIAACAAAFVFAACGDNPEFDARTDTVYSLETPSVTAKAYPGVNVVSWKPVTGAERYKVTVYEEGAFKRDVTSTDSNLKGNSYTDTALTNGKTYTYYVEAVSKSDPAATSAREVFVKNSRGEASVKAIVPPYGTESLDLAAYEGGYDGTNVKTVSENEKFSAKDITVTQNNDGYVYVRFPMKAYLSYTVNYYNNNLNSLEPDSNVEPADSRSVISDLNANNALGQVAFSITNAGTYQIAVVASPINRNYVTSKEVPYGTITIKQLELKPIEVKKTENNITTTTIHNTTNVSAEYIYDDYKFVEGAKKTARISFTPAQKKDDNEYVPSRWYKVYRRVAGDYENTPLAAVTEVVAKENDKDKETKYYVDDKDLDVNKDYVYTVVVTNDGKYGIAETVSLGRKSRRDFTNSIRITNNASTVEDNKVTWTVEASEDAKTATIIAKYLVVQDDERNKAVPVLATDITTDLTLTPKTGVTGSYTAETPAPAITGSTATVYLLVTATKEGYETTNIIKSQKLSKIN